MTAGEKVVWAALYAQALAAVPKTMPLGVEVPVEAAKLATSQLHALRCAVSDAPALFDTSWRYQAKRVLE